MTKLNLSEACLLEASGELGESSRQRLQAYLQKHPEARTQLETIKAEFDLLRTAPRLKMSEQARRQMAGRIKAGIQKKLRAKEREVQSNKRWKLIYQSLAGISAAAAALVIVAGLSVINYSITQTREQERILAINEAVRSMTSLERPSNFDYELADVESTIEEVQGDASAVARKDTDMHKLLSVLATLASEREEIMPPPEPGSL